MFTRRDLLGLVGTAALPLLAACQASPTAPAAPTSALVAAQGAPMPPTGSAPTTAAAAQPRRGGTLRVGYNQEHKTLDPHLSLQIAERYVFYAVFNTVVGTDDNFDPQPELAESWTTPDPTSYVFKLRPGVKFHDGTDFDADVVKWNIDRLKDPATKSPRANDIKVVTSVDVLDPLTVKFNLSQPYAPLPAVLMDRPGFMMSPTAARQYGPDIGTHPVGTGPFKFVQWTHDQGVTVERNPAYWSSALPHLDGVNFQVVNDPTVRATMLRSGQLDLIDRLDPHDVPTLQADQNVRVLQFKGGVWYGWQWQVDTPPFDNKALRQGIAWAINRDAIGKIQWSGFGRIPPGPITIPWARADAITPIGYDPDKARQLLSQAGISSGFEATLTVRAQPDDTRLGELIQSQLADVGVKVNLATINPDEWTAAQQQRKINWTTTSWTQRADPDGLLSLLFKTGGTANTLGYSNPQVDDLLNKAAAITDQAYRGQLYQQVQQIVVDDAPFVYLWQPSFFYAINPRVQGLQDIPDNIMRVAPLWLSA